MIKTSLGICALLICSQVTSGQFGEKNKGTPRLPGGVPVVNPSPQKGSDIFPPTNFGDHAILPLSLVKNKVSGMKIGELSYVSTKAIKVDSKRRVWIDSTMLTGPRSTRRIILVRRESNGFHVVLEQLNNYQWNAEDINFSSRYLPVRTISVK